MLNNIKIAISGKSGCGNTTVSRLVAERLRLRHINYTFHNMAEEMGISFDELCSRAEEDSRFDLYLDKKQVELARGGNCVLGSRLAIWMLKDAHLKVYLDAPLEVRAARIFQREGEELKTVLANTLKRDENDHKRYLKLYHIDNNDFRFVDLIIDVEKLNQFEVTEKIVEAAKKLKG
ncbi:MAG: (d)CMP kinase [Spirochaetota bacterium]